MAAGVFSLGGGEHERNVMKVQIFPHDVRMTFNYLQI